MTVTVPAATPSPWPVAPATHHQEEVRIAGAGRMLDLDEFLAATYTKAFVVVVDGVIVAERYFDGVGPQDPLIGYSATKSVLSLLVGAAGLDVAAPAAQLVPALAGTAYESVNVEQLLTMTSGVDWFEGLRDPSGQAARLMVASRYRPFVLGLSPRTPPGMAFRYCTADTLVLDWVRERATGLDFAAHLGWLWKAIGASSPATVRVDADGVAMAGGGLAATARDWARLGLVQLDGGGIVPRDWILASSAPSAPFLEPGRLPSTITTHAGFGYHWWPLDTSGERVMADGMFGQMVYVDRARRVVVVKLSQWPYDDPWVDRQCRDLCYLGLPAIAASFGRLTTPLEGVAAGAWDPAAPIDAPLRLHSCAVRPEWVDYNEHLSESSYLLVFGDNSDAFFRYFGIDEAYRAGGHSLYTVETHLTNLREVRLGAPLQLTLRVLDVDDKRVRVFHEMFHDGELLATAEQLLLHVDMRAGRVAPLPPELRRRLEAIRAAHADLPIPPRVGRCVGGVRGLRAG